MTPAKRPVQYGYAAAFDDPEKLLQAARLVRGEGYRHVRAYTPFPVEGLAEATGFQHNRLPLLVLAGGITGGTGGYLMQVFACTLSYPVNVGGRPHDSWPSFIPITFELTVLLASLTAFCSVFALSGLPKLYHPIFNAPRFERETQDRFYLCIEATDPIFKQPETLQFLNSLGPREVVEVEA